MHCTARLVCSGLTLAAVALVARPALAQPGLTAPGAAQPAPPPLSQPAVQPAAQPDPAAAPLAQPDPAAQPYPAAQPGPADQPYYPPQPYADPYAPAQPEAAPEPEEPAEPPRKLWSASLYAEGVGLNSKTIPSQPATELLGLGIQAWRSVHKRIDVGGSVAKLSGNNQDDLPRKTTLVALMGRLHLLPDKNWNPYGAIGLGVSFDDILFRDNATVFKEFRGTWLELGLGIERRWPNGLSAGGELHLINAARSDSAGDGGEFAGSPGGPVAPKSDGVMLRVQASYRF